MRCTCTATSALAGRQRHLPVHPRRPAPSVALGHLPHADQRVRPGPQHHLLQVPDPRPVPLPRRLEDPPPQPPYVLLMERASRWRPSRARPPVRSPFHGVQLALRFGRPRRFSAQRLTCPRQRPFGPGHKPGIRPVITGTARRGGGLLPVVPAAFRPPAFASWASCSRRGFRPSYGRPTERPAAARDPDGVSTFRTPRYGRGGCPLYPGTSGALTGGDPPAAACRLSAARPSPRPSHPLPGLAITRHHRGFTRFTRPAFPSPVAPRMERGPWASSPGFAPARQDPRRTPGRGRARALTRSYASPASDRPSNLQAHSQCATSCRTASVSYGEAIRALPCGRPSPSGSFSRRLTTSLPPGPMMRV